ncbi:MAG1140 family protein [Mycoplasma marinum]|uniref:Uncharacterized protein n=1 Tax=Mycoplasma marinum TaxID=1937190 RepID=A0A4R0XTY5_9MOLU|nr:hypothetical protein [Mycoplasma marinum]TCG11119.1 hypothetical protein C4B24_02895 [Mycoplasma marinum]
MKNLSKIPKYVSFLFVSIGCIVILTIFSIGNMNIEEYITTTVIISKNGVNKLLVNASDMMEIKGMKKLRLRVRSSFYDVTVQSVENKENGKVEITLTEENSNFITSSTLEARIIYSSISVWQKIISR